MNLKIHSLYPPSLKLRRAGGLTPKEIKIVSASTEVSTVAKAMADKPARQGSAAK